MAGYGADPEGVQVEKCGYRRGGFMTEINPNHAVTQMMHDNWHKVVALMMVRFGITEFRITEEMVRSMPTDKAVAFDARGGAAIVRFISLEEAKRLAIKEGGLPV